MTKLLSLAGFIVFAATAAQARGERGSWDAVKQLQPGQPIAVSTIDSDISTGSFRSATDDSLTYRVKGEDKTVARREIHSVGLREASRRLKRGLVWAGILGGAATAATLVVAAPCNGEGQFGSCAAKGLPAIAGQLWATGWAGVLATASSIRSRNIGSILPRIVFDDRVCRPLFQLRTGRRSPEMRIIGLENITGIELNNEIRRGARLITYQSTLFLCSRLLAA